MRRLEGPYRVYVGLVSTGYLNTEAISAQIREGMAFCGISRKLEQYRLNPAKKPEILVKPDLALADDKIARYTYTHPEVTRATIEQLLRAAPQSQINLIGKSVGNLPAYRAFKKAHGGAETFKTRGYYELLQMFPGKIKVTPMDEAANFRYQLSKGKITSNEITTIRDYALSDFSVYCPKLKSNVLLDGFSGAIALVGNDLDKFDPESICDMLEVSHPQMIVSDGIIAAVGGNHITERGHELGVILVSNNALAHDYIAAQILNLDISKVEHLKLAMERGWGPSSVAQVEIGGAGVDGIRQLCQKSRFWDLGFIPVQTFGDKFEKENPGQAFPLEIQSSEPFEASGVQGQLLDWLYRTYDFPQWRLSMSRWPKSTIRVGNVTTFPSHDVVYVLGLEAVNSLDKLTSSFRTIFKFKKIDIRFAQLKNGRRHFLIRACASENLSYAQLSLVFTIGSLGRMTLNLFRASLLFDRYLFSIRSWWRRHKHNRTTALAMTSKLPHNSWWALGRTHLPAFVPVTRVTNAAASEVSLPQ